MLRFVRNLPPVTRSVVCSVPTDDDCGDVRAKSSKRLWWGAERRGAGESWRLTR